MQASETPHTTAVHHPDDRPRFDPTWIFPAILVVASAVTCSVLPRQSLIPAAIAEEHGNKANGAVLFHERGCEHCHGANGTGGELGPDLSAVGKRRKKPEIEHQIVAGGGGMPAFGDALQPEEIRDLVEFLSQKRKAAATAASPAIAPR